MTTLYRPVLIESAEQAEALPIGTVAQLYDLGDDFHDAAVKIDHDDWRTAMNDAVMDWTNHYVVGWTALVPIEAEEERDDEWADYGGANRVRLVTPWEDAR